MSPFPDSLPLAASAAILLMALAPGLDAQSRTIDVDDGTLVQPPVVAFPFYTPGGGSLGYTTRAQSFCPPTFIGLQGVPQSLVTHVGLQLAGREVYEVFTLRAGATTVPALTHHFALNLPDQRPHVDLQDVTLVGGMQNGVPANEWVMFPLDRPFLWTPGDGVVVDVTAKIKFTDRYCLTGTSVNLQRLTDQNHQGSAAGTLQQSNGLKFRLILAPTGIVPFGSACPGTGGSQPTLGSTGSSSLGSTDYSVTLTRALPQAPSVLFLGGSKRWLGGVALPLDLGGGCAFMTSAELVVPVLVIGGVPGTGQGSVPLSIPVASALQGQAAYAQFAQLDPSSGARLPVTLSEGGIVLIW